MAVHRVFAENEARGDVAIGQSLGDEIEHLQLTSAQIAERAVRRFGGKRRARVAELLEHRLGAGAFAVCSDLAEVLDRGLDLALCLIGPP